VNLTYFFRYRNGLGGLWVLVHSMPVPTVLQKCGSITVKMVL